MTYNPTMMRWMEADPTGAEYVDGPNLYQLEQSSPVDSLDPTGTRIFFKKDDANNVITLYALFRYLPGPGCDKGTDLSKIAADHKKILEDSINKANYTYTGDKTSTVPGMSATVAVHYTIRLKVLIVTGAVGAEPAATADNLAARVAWYVDSTAFQQVKVSMIPQPLWHPDLIPGDKNADPDYASQIVHELIGHGLNNLDEYNDLGHNWAAGYAGAHGGMQPEQDSIMGNARPGRFYQRHWAAGIDNINNLTGQPGTMSNTSSLDGNDAWFGDSPDSGATLARINEIIGGM